MATNRSVTKRQLMQTRAQKQRPSTGQYSHISSILQDFERFYGMTYNVSVALEQGAQPPGKRDDLDRVRGDAEEIGKHL